MGVLNTILVIIMALSAVVTIILVLMHSGKGTGLSDMVQASITKNAGTNVAESSLNRLTIISALIFGITICVLALTFPVGVIR